MLHDCCVGVSVNNWSSRIIIVVTFIYIAPDIISVQKCLKYNIEQINYYNMPPNCPSWTLSVTLFYVPVQEVIIQLLSLDILDINS